MQFIEYPPCSTCKKAKVWLTERGVAFDDRHITQNPPTAEELRAWQKMSDLPWKRFFNTSGMKYRELGLAAQLDSLSEDELVALLTSDGMLVKRPLLVTEHAVIPGFRAEAWEAILANR